MDFNNCKAMPCEGVTMETLIGVVKETLAISAEVLGIAQRINSNLFGIGNKDETQVEPMCMRDDIWCIRQEVMDARAELLAICDKLGI